MEKYFMQKCIIYPVLLVLVLSQAAFAAKKEAFIPKPWTPRVYPGFETQYVEVDGIQTAFLEAGQGEPVILMVHGLGGSLDGWIFNLKPLGERARAIALDLPGGSGNTRRPLDLPYTLDWYCDFITHFLDRMGIQQAVIVGNSMGGHVAAYFAWKYPERTKAAVIVDGSGMSTAFPRFLWGLVAHHPKLVEKAALKMARPKAEQTGSLTNGQVMGMAGKDGKHGGRFAATYDNDSSWMKKFSEVKGASERDLSLSDEFPGYVHASVLSAGSIYRSSMEERAKEIQVPVLVVWGKEDGLIPVPAAFEYAEAIPESLLALIPEAGHSPQIEQPEEWNALVLGYLRMLEMEEISSRTYH
jgi:pimeloyl-ACP methyl ester carboxylesterase